MASFNSIVQDIQGIRIQGASNVAKAAVRALEIVSYGHRNTNKAELVSLLNKAKTTLFKTRPTEPCMRNALNYVLEGLGEEDNLLREIRTRAEEVKKHFEAADTKITEFASRKISNNMIVFTHCHSSSVTRTLIKAKQDHYIKADSQQRN